jgi:hypothetical protein
LWRIWGDNYGMSRAQKQQNLLPAVCDSIELPSVSTSSISSHIADGVVVRCTKGSAGHGKSTFSRGGF